MRKVTLPELCGVGIDGTGKAIAWGFVEFFLEFVFTRPDLYRAEDTILWMDELRAKLEPLRGKRQEGLELLLTDKQYSLAVQHGFPDPRMGVPSDMQSALGVCRLALIRAVEVEDGGVATPAGGQAPEACGPTDTQPASRPAAEKRRSTSRRSSGSASRAGEPKKPAVEPSAVPS